MKKTIALLICVIILLTAVTPFAAAESGNIDLYKAFSNKDDMDKTEVGSRIYKWSMYLPNDGVIYKSDRVNYFSMSSSNYQASADLEVTKNINNDSLEDILYSIQNQSKQGYYYLWGDKEFQVDIAKDDNGQRYIKIIKAVGYYDYYLMDKAAEEFREYVENRIYIGNNNVYNLTVRMNGEFYSQHQEMFEKLTSSFKLSFDEKNPNIKELSDSLNSVREFKNTSYGWKMTLSPYWKAQGTPNARNQVFRPVYTDEEINQNNASSEENDSGYRISDGITVSLIGSSGSGETAKKWAQEDIKKLKSNYNKEVFELLSSKEYSRNGVDVYKVSVRFKTITKKPYIMDNLYVIGNGYKYLVSAIMRDDKYLDSAKKSNFENMLNSFSLDKTCLSKYLGKIVLAENIINMNEVKDFKMKKYNFQTKVLKDWSTNSTYSYNDMYYYIYSYGMSNYDLLTAYEPGSNIYLLLASGLNSNSMKEIITGRMGNVSTNDEIRLKLANIEIKSSKADGAEIYYITKIYDTKAIEKFVAEDETKSYNYENISNQYEYIVKVGKDIYILSASVPVANTSDVNLEKIKNLWNNTSINNVNYSKQNLKWENHKIDEFDLLKQIQDKYEEEEE